MQISGTDAPSFLIHSPLSLSLILCILATNHFPFQLCLIIAFASQYKHIESFIQDPITCGLPMAISNQLYSHLTMCETIYYFGCHIVLMSNLAIVHAKLTQIWLCVPQKLVPQVQPDFIDKQERMI